MAYMTHYNLESTISDEETKEQFHKELAKRSPGNGPNPVDLTNGGGATCSWYEHDRDMRQVSMMFPTEVFVLSGEGEEIYDMWKKRYIAGDVEEIRPTVVWPSFTSTPPDYPDFP